MAKKGSIESNEKRKKVCASFRKKRAELKKVVQDKNVSVDDRFQAVLKLAELPRSGSRVRIRNRCAVSGRARGYYRHLGLSRIALRDLASAGAIPGMTKSSW
ncbi:MAG: 30S ribosomal protein S14 [Alphaproteobacteria bacterium RIFCSPLOWO2_01_FULL_45_8]|nr:MAG: 30S ribosomal protein S14 [Alphaproteobacteria bacterium GWB1_45_5]OFW76035.1 MAG: 30S ribosomal protein S14 [Alphaproteobacteria bacterium GWA1_45_9]OFW90076.1 MAG: 30S ribosomal protein S14 [Alphaproteobacteria bacterium RIFCSPHIGHO2_01_FULL_41_14]OFW96528.1 MAG: 30S ribosomal protein S14 [Alphaproteobacteria bacterium RIFCSPLOWO2_01_FULL_45_8]HCI48547.1 30S ribosomal protein S14 [Holosporales bacterium]